MKKIILSVVAGGILSMAGSTAVLAEDELELSANVAMGTDYIWRGVSQTNNDMTIQGGFDLGYGIFYAGTWGSNVEFGSAEMEWDLYAGVADEFGDTGIGWDVGLLSYAYPGDANNDFIEAYVGLTYKWFGAYWYEQIDDPVGAEGASYWTLSADFELPHDFAAGASYGKYDFDQAGADDYSDYKLYVSKSYQGFGFEVGFTNTSGIAAGNESDANDENFYLMVSKSF